MLRWLIFTGPVTFGTVNVVSIFKLCKTATKGSPTVAKSRTPYLKSHLKSLKSLKFENLKSRTVETVISKFLYISASNHVKIGRTMSNKLLVKVTNHETS